ncbi:putative helicase MAGATAMA 3 [Vitis vinifera]|uniref:Putative helicase MAGATAMA 3 n=1 Tax=Vitis vinifera TaxID=29760 RepID=A0A438ER25_VITVI|nr:putative helicase MAGATAMA 3 [Vitis vinifera]
MAIVDRKSLEEEACILRFCKIVLGWDYVQLLKESKKNSRNIGDGSALGLRKVKDTYTDIDDYLATFEPLLFEEVKAQVVQGRDEEEVSEWKFAIVRECSETDGFSIPVVGYKAEEGESISQNDLLLLSKTKFQEGTRLPTTYAFALAEHRQGDLLRVRMWLDGEVKGINTDEVVVSCPRLLSMHSLIGNLINDPNRATDSSPSPGEQSWKISRPLMEFIETNHNESQLAAIHASLSRKAFVLIQV